MQSVLFFKKLPFPTGKKVFGCDGNLVRAASKLHLHFQTFVPERLLSVVQTCDNLMELSLGYMWDLGEVQISSA